VAVILKRRVLMPPILFHPTQFGVRQSANSPFFSKFNSRRMLLLQVSGLLSGIALVIAHIFDVKILELLAIGVWLIAVIWIIVQILKWRRQYICRNCNLRLDWPLLSHCNACGWTRPMPEFISAEQLAAYAAPLSGTSPRLLLPITSLPNSPPSG